MSTSDDARRGIGLRSTAALIAANMIGAGVFTTSGFALTDLGRPAFVLAAWGVGAVVALCGALSYAGLSATLPRNGGEYLLLSRAIHPLLGFLAGWVSIFAGFTAPIAVAAHGLEAYAAAAFGEALPTGLLGASAIAVCGALHAWTRSGGLRLQDVAVALKCVAIVLFVVLGGGALLIGFGEPASMGALASPPSAGPQAGALPGFDLAAFAVTLVWVSFAFSGWNAGIYVAGEVEDPERTMRRALVAATVGVGALYLALNAVFVFAAPVEALAGRPEVGAVAAEAIGGPLARNALSAVVALALLTSVSAMVMVGSRVYAQMAEDGLLPRVFASGGAEPRAAIALQVGLALLAFGIGELRQLLGYVGFLLGLSSAATVACVFRAGWRERVAPRVVGYPVVPLVFIAMTLGSSAFLVRREPLESAIGLATLVAGVVAWLFIRPGVTGEGDTSPPLEEPH